MFLLLDVISTEDFVNKNYLECKNAFNGVKWWKDETGVTTVAFNKFRQTVSIIEEQFLKKESCYKRNGKKYYLYAYIADLDTYKVKCFTMHELVLFLKAGNVVNGIAKKDLKNGTTQLDLHMFVDYNSYPNKSFRDYILSHAKEFQFFGIKNALLEKPFYLVQLLAVNNDKDFVFDINAIDKKELPEKLEEMLNASYTLGFYNKDTCELVCTITTSYLMAMYLYFQLEGIGYIYKRNKPILCYLNHAFEFNVKGKSIYFARQKKVGNDSAYMKHINTFTKSCPHIVTNFECDKKPIEQLNLPALMEIY